MPSKWQPALIGGLFIGVLSALPIINLANCCCLWVIGGGVITAYLLQNQSPTAITVGDGALGGLVAGMIGAVVDAVISIPVHAIMGPFQAEFARRFTENAGDVPESLRMFMHPGGAGYMLSIIGGFFLMIVVGAIFSTIGGMIGAAIFSRGKPALVPPPPPTYTPPPSYIPPSPPPPPPAPPTEPPAQ